MRLFSLQWRVLKVNFVFQDARVTGLEAEIRNVTDKQQKRAFLMYATQVSAIINIDLSTSFTIIKESPQAFSKACLPWSSQNLLYWQSSITITNPQLFGTQITSLLCVISFHQTFYSIKAIFIKHFQSNAQISQLPTVPAL